MTDERKLDHVHNHDYWHEDDHGHEHDHSHDHVHNHDYWHEDEHEHNHVEASAEEHVHDENCDHDHEHIHSHKPALGEVQVNHHEEGALVASGSLKVMGADVDEITDRLSEALAQVAQKVEDAGGMIGHIKATVTRNDVRMLSTTATNTDVSVKVSPQAEILINLAFIVFLVEADELLKWAQEVMDALQS